MVLGLLEHTTIVGPCKYRSRFTQTSQLSHVRYLPMSRDYSLWQAVC